MLPPKKTRDLARILVAREILPDTGPLQTEPATARVYERLRRQLGTSVGADSFQALASRALALAKAESPLLNAVQLTANGGLYGLDEIHSQNGPEEDGEAGILLIAQLLGLFLIFLGEVTTMRLIEDLRLQADAATETAATQPSVESIAADETLAIRGFEDLLLEIDRLRSVSDHIEFLASTHPGMEDGLVSVAGSIRSIATVLDVFTLIRSRAGGPEDMPDLQTNLYMN